MDVDGDVDSQLLQQFSSMATTDREVLIAEFQRLLGNRLSDAGCAFFLDMNNWQVISFHIGVWHTIVLSVILANHLCHVVSNMIVTLPENVVVVVFFRRL